MDEKDKENIKGVVANQLKRLPRTVVIFLIMFCIGLFFVYQLVKIIDEPLKTIVVVLTLLYVFYCISRMFKTVVNFDALAEVEEPIEEVSTNSNDIINSDEKPTSKP
ncbi:hypothetical protein G0Q62_000726 [Listeria monocytogenes]|nr:hypothetical protein [Listeria monocytogenes]